MKIVGITVDDDKTLEVRFEVETFEKPRVTLNSEENRFGGQLVELKIHGKDEVYEFIRAIREIENAY